MMMSTMKTPEQQLGARQCKGTIDVTRRFNAVPTTVTNTELKTAHKRRIGREHPVIDKREHWEQ